MALLGLVTVLFNSDDVLEGFFKSLSIQTFQNYHLYVVDNSPAANTDHLITALAKQYASIAYTHIKNDKNYGVATGNNQGIKRALDDRADLILLLNNDIEFSQSGLFHDMVERAVNNDENMIIPKIFYFGTRTIQTAGGEFINYKGTSRSIGNKRVDDVVYNKAQYFDYAPTCFMLISKKVFETIGYMDEKYFVYYDDNDFVMRAIKKGFKVYYMPNLEIFHKVSFSTGGHESLFSIYQLNRNRIYFIKKHFKLPLKQIALTHAVITKGIRYLFYYNKKEKRALARAFKDGFKMKTD